MNTRHRGILRTRKSIAVLCGMALLLLGVPGLASPGERLPVPAQDKSAARKKSAGCSAEIGGGRDVDSAWETCSGGSLNIEIADASTGGDKVQTTTPGHKYVDTITLRGPMTSGRKGTSNQDEILENGSGKFAVEIDGLSVASTNVESITMEDLVIDQREMTTGADWDYRVYGPGDAHYGSITIRSRMDGNKELYDWWQEAAQGKSIRKSISVIMLKRDGTEARRYNYLECFPVSYIPHSLDQPDRPATEGVIARCGGVTFEGEDPKGLYQWINETIAGKDSRRTLSLSDSAQKQGRSLRYSDAFPVRYVFPQLSASGTGNLYEEITIKPIRMELG